MPSKNQSKLLKKIKGQTHSIYGIFDFKLGILISVNIDQESLELEYDLQNYNEDRFKIVTFEVILF